jgi:hypothetical protein
MEIKILVVLFFCHFLADYTHLSTNWMLKAKRYGEPLHPILAHAAVHGILMFICLLLFGINFKLSLILGLIQIWLHFMIDVWKGKMSHHFPTLRSNTNKWHWIIFGFDQYLHSLVIILMWLYAIGYEKWNIN